MNEILKQRLVGALILVALGVVFWPIIFVEPGDISAAAGQRIPAHPEVNTSPIPAPQKDDLRQAAPLEARKQLEQDEASREAQAAISAKAKVAPLPEQSPAGSSAATIEAKPEAAKPAAKSEPVKPEPVTKERITRTESPAKPVIDADGVPVAWILQVASVSDADKAEELRSRLLKMGHKAYVKKVRRAGNTLLRVYIGPKFERAQLEKIQSGVDKEFGVESIVVRYLP